LLTELLLLLLMCHPVLQNSPSSKGCGLVQMRSYSDAVMAIAGLDNYKWEGMHSAMVVKLMPPQRQRQEQLETAASGECSVACARGLSIGC
jgi:hypothetical protein